MYAWRVGSAQARQVTKDGASVFAGWFQDGLVVSQPSVDGQPAGPTADPATVVASTFLVDPQTGARQALARPAWRPVVDPTSRRAIAWIGTFAWDPVEMAWVPASGRLMAMDWASLLDPTIPLDLQALPGTDGTDVTRWDARWDPSARHLAIWTGSASTETGQLTLYAVDGDGALSTALVKSATALPAFSLDADRLAWATPPGGNGEGSTVSVFAWTAGGSGQLSSGPDTTGEPVVIAH